MTISRIWGEDGEKVKFAFGFWFGGSITSIVRLIVAVPPSLSSTSSEIVYVPPAENDRDALEPVWSSNAPSSSRSQFSARIRFSGSLASDVEEHRLVHQGRVRRPVEVGARLAVRHRDGLLRRGAESLVVGDRQLHRVDARGPIRMVHVRALSAAAIVEIPLKLREDAVVGRRRAERDVLSAARRAGAERK